MIALGAHGTPGGGAVFIYETGFWDPIVVQPENPGSFGRSVSLSLDRLLVGAPYTDAFGEAAGLACVYFHSDAGWQKAGSLTPAGINPEDRFGWTVDLDGDFAIVGTPYAQAAWVFRFDGQQWLEEDRLYAPAYDFGECVAIEGTVAVVGAPDDNTQGMWAGAAFVFERQPDATWLQTAKLLPLPGQFQSFGDAVAIDGGVIVVGAPGQGAGVTHVFEKDEAGVWQRVAAFSDPNVPEGAAAEIGWSVAIDGDIIVSGAPQYYENPNAVTGAAYVYTRNAAGAWSMAGLLLAEDGTAWDWFGNAVAVSGNLAVIGAPRDEPFGPWSGSAYVFAVGPDDDGDGVMDACVCTGDVDGDWRVDQADLGILLAEYNIIPRAPLRADLNGDGAVNQQDLG
ncbi:MAG TPA: hypothetical protein PKC49_13120, partial [Phycisphaerae bacterium]|nr:hypothetical protein [Phycisphaerae bacterium]